MSTRRIRLGFTIVELLMVILIIGLLLALIFPALQVARERARQVDCQARMVRVAKGMTILSDRRNQYPGWRNPIRGADPVSWVVPLLPYIDRPDLHDAWFAKPGKAPPTRPKARIDLLVCPSDQNHQSTPGPLLSYVVNAGRPDSESDTNPPDARWAGVFMDHVPSDANRPVVRVTPSYVQSQDGLSSTLLLAESLNATVWTDAAAEHRTCMVWLEDDPVPDAAHINSKTPGLPHQQARPSSSHRLGANAVMASGAARWLSQGMDYDLYRRLMTPCDDASHDH